MNRARVGVLIGVLLACALGTSAEATGGRTSRVFPEDELNTGRTLHAISGDGRWIAYSTYDHADPWYGTGANSILFVRDLQTDTDYRVTPPRTHFTFGGMSDDGSVVAFATSIDIAAAGDANGQSDGFLWHRSTGVLTLATVSDAEAQGDRGSYDLELSDDGTKMLFRTASTNFATGAGSAVVVYVRDVTAGTTTLVNVLPGGSPGPQPHAQRLSGDGTKVVFEDDYTSYVSGDPHGGAFIRDMATGVITRASVRIDGTADPQTYLLAIDEDGSHVAWSWNGNIKVRDLGSGTTTQAHPSAGFLTGFDLTGDAEHMTWVTGGDAVVLTVDTGVTRKVAVTDGGQRMGASRPHLTDDASKAFFDAVPPPGGPGDIYVHEFGGTPASTCPDGDAQQGQVSGPLYDLAVRLGVEDDVVGPNCDEVVDAGY